VAAVAGEGLWKCQYCFGFEGGGGGVLKLWWLPTLRPHRWAETEAPPPVLERWKIFTFRAVFFTLLLTALLTIKFLSLQIDSKSYRKGTRGVFMEGVFFDEASLINLPSISQ
jgi:hypothetical protein